MKKARKRTTTSQLANPSVHVHAPALHTGLPSVLLAVLAPPFPSAVAHAAFVWQTLHVGPPNPAVHWLVHPWLTLLERPEVKAVREEEVRRGFEHARVLQSLPLNPAGHSHVPLLPTVP